LDITATPLLQLRPRELTSGVLCTVIFRQFGDTIRVQKEHVAVPNLEKIILAALDIGRRKGFHSTTTRDLAEASGLSMGAIYNYVESKETLLRMILAGVDYAIEHAILPYDKGEQDEPALRLFGLIRRHIEVSDILQRWFAFAFLEIKAFDKDARDIVLQSELHNERVMADAIADGITKGIFIDLPPLTLAGMIMPLLQDWYIKRWKFRKRGMTSAAYVDAVSGFVNRAIARPL
jgi:AcrR family transcriptional regulator